MDMLAERVDCFDLSMTFNVDLMMVMVVMIYHL